MLATPQDADINDRKITSSTTKSNERSPFSHLAPTFVDRNSGHTSTRARKPLSTKLAVFRELADRISKISRFRQPSHAVKARKMSAEVEVEPIGRSGWSKDIPRSQRPAIASTEETKAIEPTETPIHNPTLDESTTERHQVQQDPSIPSLNHTSATGGMALQQDVGSARPHSELKPVQSKGHGSDIIVYDAAHTAKVESGQTIALTLQDLLRQLDSAEAKYLASKDEPLRAPSPPTENSLTKLLNSFAGQDSHDRILSRTSEIDQPAKAVDNSVLQPVQNLLGGTSATNPTDRAETAEQRQGPPARTKSDIPAKSTIPIFDRAVPPNNASEQATSVLDLAEFDSILDTSVTYVQSVAQASQSPQAHPSPARKWSGVDSTLPRTGLVAEHADPMDNKQEPPKPAAEMDPSAEKAQGLESATPPSVPQSEPAQWTTIAAGSGWSSPSPVGLSKNATSVSRKSSPVTFQSGSTSRRTWRAFTESPVSAKGTARPDVVPDAKTDVTNWDAEYAEMSECEADQSRPGYSASRQLSPTGSKRGEAVDRPTQGSPHSGWTALYESNDRSPAQRQSRPSNWSLPAMREETVSNHSRAEKSASLLRKPSLARTGLLQQQRGPGKSPDQARRKTELELFDDILNETDEIEIYAAM